jgi:hypothetical protein
MLAITFLRRKGFMVVQMAVFGGLKDHWRIGNINNVTKKDLLARATARGWQPKEQRA